MNRFMTAAVTTATTASLTRRQPLFHCPIFNGNFALVLNSKRWIDTATTTTKSLDDKSIKVNYLDGEGKEFIVYGSEGQDIMRLAHENDIELEGACEGSLACSTCHVIVDSKYYNQLPEPSDEENDMLDLAFGLTETSRLGCQVKLKRELNDIKVTIPSATRNMAVDGFKPKPH